MVTIVIEQLTAEVRQAWIPEVAFDLHIERANKLLILMLTPLFHVFALLKANKSLLFESFDEALRKSIGRFRVPYFLNKFGNFVLAMGDTRILSWFTSHCFIHCLIILRNNLNWVLTAYLWWIYFQTLSK